MPLIRRLRIGFVLGLALLLAPGRAAGETILAFTGYLPPLSLSAADRGIAVEVMALVAARAGVEIEIRFQPWTKARQNVRQTPGALLFPIGRTLEIEAEYHWIAPLFHTTSGFVSLQTPVDSYQAAIDSNGDIGVARGSGHLEILRRQGVTRLTEAASDDQLLAMLSAGRIEAWYTMLWRAVHLIRQDGGDQARVAFGKPLRSAPLYLAAHKEFDRYLAYRLEQAIAEVRASPDYQAIIDRYIK